MICGRNPIKYSNATAKVSRHGSVPYLDRTPYCLSGVRLVGVCLKTDIPNMCIERERETHALKGIRLRGQILSTFPDSTVNAI